MVKINPSVTIELAKGRQTIRIDIEEARQIIRDLGRFVQDTGYSTKPTRPVRIQRKKQNARKIRILPANKTLHMSDAKRKQIIDHVNKKLSTRPRTLSNLLNGVSYVPNYLPSIRLIVEKQTSVAKKIIGKRTFYFKK
jgi:hypothetical protein